MWTNNFIELVLPHLDDYYILVDSKDLPVGKIPTNLKKIITTLSLSQSKKNRRDIRKV